MWLSPEISRSCMARSLGAWSRLDGGEIVNRIGRRRQPRAAPSHEHLVEESPQPLVARTAEDLLGRADLEDRALVQEDDAVGDLAREAHLVRRDQHRHALA